MASATICQVPTLDLKAQYSTIRAEIQQAINSTLERQHFILGPEVSALEKEIAADCQRQFAVGVASGTDAIILGLKSIGIQPGDEVIVPAFSFIATADAVSMVGAQPVFVDIEPHSFNLDPSKLRFAMTSKTRAIIVVHLYGLPADMDPILSFAQERGLKVIEDTAQALGASYLGKPAASMGDVGCVSFFPSKNLGGYGDGGMVLTNSEETFTRLKRLRSHGCVKKYVSEELGWNSRLDELQAAVLRVKLRHLHQWSVERRKKAARYSDLLSIEPAITTPVCPHGSVHVFHQYTVRILKRDKVQLILSERGISSTVYYPVPICLQPIYRHLGYQPGDLPETDRACETVLSLPIYPEMTEDQQEYVARELIQAVRTV